MKKIVGLIFFVMVIFGNLFTQNNDNYNSKVISSDKIDSLVQLHIKYNQEYPVFMGYRIQILKASGNEAIDAIEESKMEFSEKYINIPVYLTFDEPDYRVRVGDFRTRLEAEEFLKKINREYPGAWVIQDDINFPDLPKYKKTESYE